MYFFLKFLVHFAFVLELRIVGPMLFLNSVLLFGRVQSVCLFA
jgi:hypothetical protein